MPADITMELNGSTFGPLAQEAVYERLRSRIPLEIDSGLAHHMFPIDTIPHDVLVKIAQDVLPLKELYAGFTKLVARDTAPKAYLRPSHP